MRDLATPTAAETTPAPTTDTSSPASHWDDDLWDSHHADRAFGEAPIVAPRRNVRIETRRTTDATLGR